MSEKFLCVNPFITERLQKTYPHRKDKIDTLWTWVNTDIFKPQPCPRALTVPDRVCGQAGRIQATTADVPRHRALAAATEGRRRLPLYRHQRSAPIREFAAIEDITVRHGFKDAAGMAATLASAHAGILTSEFEGMPRFVLEILAVGRPVVAVHLPQLEPVIPMATADFWWRAAAADDMADALAIDLSMSATRSMRRDGSGRDRRRHRAFTRAHSWRGSSATIRRSRMRADWPSRSTY